MLLCFTSLLHVRDFTAMRHFRRIRAVRLPREIAGTVKKRIMQFLLSNVANTHVTVLLANCPFYNGIVLEINANRMGGAQHRSP